MQQAVDESPQKYMAEIHRLIQKLKDGGMAVDSTITTTTSIVDDTVKYTDSLVITGDIVKNRFDPRPLEDVKESALEEKSRIQAQSDKLIGEVDKVINLIDSK